uniref:BTB domain-containing protein n=1 Tax=Steinernema glaseri TaxID=37863 RepID=A0A1I8A113_9BILA
MSVAETSPMTMKAENGEQVFPMQIVKPVKIPKMWVRLNVGGRIFQTTRQTLMRESESFLARICQEDGDLPSETDETGAYLIDRDSDYFSTVLNYLRHGKIVIDRGLSLEGVLEEAEFYNLPRLIHMCNEKILEREKKTAALVRSKHVYRVLQCHEDELTNVISAMSDDWKFEQLIPIGTYSSDMQSEYLCVVSRECQDTQTASSPVEPSDRAKVLQAKARHSSEVLCWLALANLHSS